jgi:hypothetical protein
MSRTVEYSIDNGELVVSFDYQPKEGATRYYPGCDEDVDIFSVTVGDVEILSILSGKYLALIKEYCLESVHNENETNRAKNEE